MFYVAFGLSSISYVSHGIILHGWETQASRISLDWMSWMATVNLVGATIYVARVSIRSNAFLAGC
jgi:adiponectin receptor